MRKITLFMYSAIWRVIFWVRQKGVGLALLGTLLSMGMILATSLIIASVVFGPKMPTTCLTNCQNATFGVAQTTWVKWMGWLVVAGFFAAGMQLLWASGLLCKSIRSRNKASAEKIQIEERIAKKKKWNMAKKEAGALAAQIGLGEAPGDLAELAVQKRKARRI
jgi:hypothetical protein